MTRLSQPACAPCAAAAQPPRAQLYQRPAQQAQILEQAVANRTAELSASEARYRRLTELASDWYWEQDAQGRFVNVSGPLLEVLGIRADTLEPETAGTDAGGWNKSERQTLRQRIASRGPFLDFAFSRINADGSRQEYRVSGEPMFNDTCRLIGCRGIGPRCSSRAERARPQDRAGRFAG